MSASPLQAFGDAFADQFGLLMLPRLDRLPQRFRHDAQGFIDVRNPIRRSIGHTAAAFAIGRTPYPAMAIPYHAACIQLVVKNADAATSITCDCSAQPAGASALLALPTCAGRGDALDVQLIGNCARAETISIHLKDADNDRGLLAIYLPLSGRRISRGDIAVCAATSGPMGASSAFESSARAASDLLPIAFAHRAKNRAKHNAAFLPSVEIVTNNIDAEIA